MTGWIFEEQVAVAELVRNLAGLSVAVQDSLQELAQSCFILDMAKERLIGAEQAYRVATDPQGWWQTLRCLFTTPGQKARLQTAVAQASQACNRADRDVTHEEELLTMLLGRLRHVEGMLVAYRAVYSDHPDASTRAKVSDAIRDPDRFDFPDVLAYLEACRFASPEHAKVPEQWSMP